MRRIYRWLLLIAAVVGGSALVVVLAGFVFLWWIFGEKFFSERAAVPVTAAVLNGTLAPNSVGIVKLPASLASNSCDGRIYVTVDASGTTWILFPTWRGKGCNVRAYLYRSTPATGPPPATITVRGPDINNGSQQMNYQVDHKIDANWYYVVWDLD